MKDHTLVSCRQFAIAIEAEHFETLHKLYRVTAYIIKFLKILRKKSKAGLATQDLHEAELLWIKDNQLEGTVWTLRTATRSGGAEEGFRMRDYPFLQCILYFWIGPTVWLNWFSQCPFKVLAQWGKESLSEVHGKFWILK